MKVLYAMLLCAAWLLLVQPGDALSAEEKSCNTGELKVEAEFENGKLYRTGKFSILELSGTYRQMGRQYGTLLKDDLNTFYQKAVEKYFIKERGISRERLETIARAVYDLYPARYKEIIQGMAETSGLGMNKQILLNAVEWYPKIGHLKYGGCSAIAAWGPYASNGSLVIGRNNDDNILFRDFAHFLTIAVFKPGDGGHSAAIINYAGAVYNPTGMNSQGLFVEMNAGPWMGFSLIRTSIFTTLFSILQDYASVAEADPAFRSILPNLSSIITVADREEAASFESSLYDTRRADPETEGLVAATNHFVKPGWNIAWVDESMSDNSLTRRNNLLALGEKYRGKFNPEVMMKVLDTTIGQGGATVEGTIYQVVAEPESLTIWLKAPGIQDWTKMPLARVFGQ